MAPRKIPLEERLEKRTRKTENGCWKWLGLAKDVGGYPLMKFEGKTQKVATLVYKLKKGPIPEGLEVSHICQPYGNAWCINPDHLIVETHKENLARRRPFRGGKCKRGHDLPPIGQRKTNGCPICKKETLTQWHEKNRDHEKAYRDANKEKLQAQGRAYYRKNKQRALTLQRIRRAVAKRRIQLGDEPKL